MKDIVLSTYFALIWTTGALGTVQATVYALVSFNVLVRLTQDAFSGTQKVPFLTRCALVQTFTRGTTIRTVATCLGLHNIKLVCCTDYFLTDTSI